MTKLTHRQKLYLDERASHCARMAVEAAGWDPTLKPGMPLTVTYDGKTYTGTWDELCKQLQYAMYVNLVLDAEEV